MNSSQAIETRYKGYRFRSRLEARWAVFLDKMEEPWEYEKEGFRLPGGEYYLPDFWLPRRHTWLEVKGKMPTEEELRRCELLRDVTQAAVAIFFGLPCEYLGTLFCWDEGDSSGGASQWEVGVSSRGHSPCELCFEVETYNVLFSDPLFQEEIYRDNCCGGWAEECAKDARAARFEHGEEGYDS